MIPVGLNGQWYKKLRYGNTAVLFAGKNEWLMQSG